MQFVSRTAFLLVAAYATVSWAQENPLHIHHGDAVDRVVTLKQNWSDEESNWFYNVPQGSRLLPYDWFLHLEQPASVSPFFDPEHIRDLGYIPRNVSADNPDGLPLGFVKDAAYDDGTAGLGLTCAACHTSQINHGRVGYIIDGGPAMGDMQTLMKHLVASLDNTVKQDGKFLRFAGKLFGSDDSEENRKLLRSALQSAASARAGYNTRNFPNEDAEGFGHGRVDAFGAIFNEVSVTFLGISENVRPASAPVSYPCLWDAPQHDRVQWNGAAENRTSELGKLLFGTVKVGALGRNTGEVLGVFGHAEIEDHELLVPRKYASTVNKANLLEIEDSLERLWSPEWPTAFGAIDKSRKLRGEALFVENCQSCHQAIDRTADDRKVTAMMSDEGTDPAMAMNFGRTAKTGVLEGRRISLSDHERFGSEAPIGSLLKHLVQRVMLNSLPRAEIKNLLVTGKAGDEELSPGYQNTAVIRFGDNSVNVPLDSLARIGDATIQISAGNEKLNSLADMIRTKLAADPKVAGALESVVSSQERVTLSQPDDEGSGGELRVNEATASFAYKARPLNGIWATAPYLHNGSVPTLWELLLPEGKRKPTFHVGSIEFDPVHVGFVDDARFPTFDTSVDGNLNIGHEHGVDLEDDQKLDLIEYLKSL
ncbi:di-heme-cytochrome C peroxidase [Rubripirellula reticaptiva]|uniref:Cytochrome c domain-containing protein n=1 Tax=Rubripirellula reticaptiva TaxID=2528013 RepID=A0A5C6ELU8_9BACT|nr:di-heme-cytochrome C peroxidase [Rubripirellula reticaptiva]TWU49465.1 hypothetical protein Poly59_40800 [Rubripirellula reticaptiva]